MVLAKLFVAHSPPMITPPNVSNKTHRTNDEQRKTRTHEACYITKPLHNNVPVNTPQNNTPQNCSKEKIIYLPNNSSSNGIIVSASPASNIVSVSARQHQSQSEAIKDFAKISKALNISKFTKTLQ